MATRVKRQFAIASAGRTASTSLYQTLIATLQVGNSVFPIWDFSPANLLAEAYAGDRFDYVVVKSETFHFIHHLRCRDRTTLILLTRRDHLRQIVSHIVSLRSGRFHVAGGRPARAQPFRIERHEFLSLAHMVLMAEAHFRTADFSGFDRVERWTFEDLGADFPAHIERLGLERPRRMERTGVGYDAGTVLNLPEVLDWAAGLAGAAGIFRLVRLELRRRPRAAARALRTRQGCAVERHRPHRLAARTRPGKPAAIAARGVADP